MFSIEFASVKGSLFLLQKAPSILPLSFFLTKWTEVVRPPRKIRQKKISFKSTAEGISLWVRRPSMASSRVRNTFQPVGTNSNIIVENVCKCNRKVVESTKKSFLYRTIMISLSCLTKFLKKYYATRSYRMFIQNLINIVISSKQLFISTSIPLTLGRKDFLYIYSMFQLDLVDKEKTWIWNYESHNTIQSIHFSLLY